MTKITNTTSKTLTTTTTTPITNTTTSTAKQDWCNLDNYEINVQKRLNSSKEIIVVAAIDDNTYEKAKSVCEDICGRLYFPSTLKENDEVESVLVHHLKNYGYNTNNVWLRMTYNETAETWYDPDNKEDLTFLNFDESDKILDLIFAKQHYAKMDYDGQWRSRSCFYHYSPYVLCELT